MTHFVALLLIGTLAAAYLAAPLHRSLRFDVADRWLVATVIARVAVAGSPRAPPVLGIARLGAAAGAESLLVPAPQQGVATPGFVISGLALAVTIASAVSRASFARGCGSHASQSTTHRRSKPGRS